MKTAPDKCPFCESPIMVHGGNLLRSDNCGFATYECRTVYDVELADNQWKRAEQSMACKTRENQLLTKQRDEARERIKRLEEDSQRLNWLLKRGLAWRDCYNDWWKEGEWLYASQSALETIDKAKEAKP